MDKWLSSLDDGDSGIRLDLLRQLLRRPDVEYQLHIRDVLERSAHELETRGPRGSEYEEAGHLL